MRVACYIVRTVVIKQGENPVASEDVFFGTVQDLETDLEKLQRLNKQAQLAHANDPEMLAMLLCKEEVIKTLRSHDLDKLPAFPNFGGGQAQRRYKECPNVAFLLEIKVSIRGDKSLEKLNNQPLNILLPPGVNL